MVSDAYKTLYQGQLPASVTTLATVGTGLAWIVKHMTIVNNDSVARTFALYKNGAVAANIISPPAGSIPAGGMAEWDGTMALAAAETLRGIAGAATMLTLTVEGDEVTL